MYVSNREYYVVEPQFFGSNIPAKIQLIEYSDNIETIFDKYLKYVLKDTNSSWCYFLCESDLIPAMMGTLTSVNQVRYNPAIKKIMLHYNYFREHIEYNGALTSREDILYFHTLLGKTNYDIMHKKIRAFEEQMKTSIANADPCCALL